MFKHLLIIIVFFSSIFLCTSARDLPENAAGWKLTEKNAFPGQNLFTHINGGAEIYFEYGFVQLDVGYYEKDGHEIVIEKYRMTDPLAAFGIHSLTRDLNAPRLPDPFLGRIYDFYLDFVNGKDYIKIVNYDTISFAERLLILKAMVPKPLRTKEVRKVFDVLPEKRIHGSETIFKGELALKNYCMLGQTKDFNVGRSVEAAGCLVAHAEKKYRCVVLSGKADVLKAGLNSFLANIVRKDYQIKRQDQIVLLEDAFSDDYILIVPQADRLNFVFKIPLSMTDELVKFF